MGTVNGSYPNYTLYGPWLGATGTAFNAGGSGYQILNGANFTVYGTASITGGTGGTSGRVNPAIYNGGSGGAGVYINGAGHTDTPTLTNHGSITGGTGGFGGEYSGGYGGTGIESIGPAALYNFGQITGGRGGYQSVPSPSSYAAGGMGVDLIGSTLINEATGSITGASGNIGTYGGFGGTGAGLDGGTLTNDGHISGGASGASGYAGGSGVVQQAGTLINNGYITAGSSYGVGGLGVNLTGGTLINNGNITGSAAGVDLDGGTLATSGTISGSDSIKFGSVASTLVVDSGAVFNGALGGFRLGDTVDITNLTPTQVAADFNSTTHVLTTPGDGTLDFSGGFSNEYFVFSSDGGTGTDITLAPVLPTVKGSYPNYTLYGPWVGATPAHGAGGSGYQILSGANFTVYGTASITGAAGASANGYAYNGGNGGSGIYINGAGHTDTPTLTNHGNITGGAGGAGYLNIPGGNGGIGVDSVGPATVYNFGRITGGAAYAQIYNPSIEAFGPGGLGVSLDGGTLTNETSGSITGGSGISGNSFYVYSSGYGGTGVESNGSATLNNFGAITGGRYSSSRGVGGAGVSLDGGTLTNETSGNITGGVGYSGGAGVVQQAGMVANNGHVTGGAGDFANSYGNSHSHAGVGGAGVILDSGTLTNETSGSITGGAGSGFLVSGAGGSGVVQQGGMLTNDGHITGGYGDGYGIGGGVGGSGVILNSGTLTNENSGSIAGGYGGLSGIPGGAGGGSGVILHSGTLTNSGHITGGNGNNAGSGPGGAGGSGVILDGGTLTNEASGSVTGGYGYFQGGAGVDVDGGTLTTSGTISGGAASNRGAAGGAVQFGSGAGTLIVDSGAVFNGQVAANATVNDTLELSGTQSGGTPITLGTQFTNFSTLDFASGAAWTVNASTGAAPSGGLIISGFTISDSIDITNLTPTQVAADFNYTTDVLTTSDGTLHFTAPPSGQAFVFLADGSGGTDVMLAAGSGISTTINTTVTLGSAPYLSPLTITSTGVVAPTAAGATGVVSNVSGNNLLSAGAIFGGTGSNGHAGGAGGLGVNFEMAGTVMNTGSIAGGKGGSGSTGAGGAGGAGVDLLAGTLSNSGSITGGTGGIGNTHGGAGGTGVILDGGTLKTFGTISGGTGGSGAASGAAGDAVDFGTVASTLEVDPGAVFNGAIGTFGLGDTVDIMNLTPAQAAADFNSTTHVLTTTGDGTLDFSGGFSNEYFVFSSNGGTGTDITLATGSGISTTLTSSVTLGSAAHPSPLTITSTGVVSPIATGATGVVSNVSGNTLINAGAIFGGTGSIGSAGGAGGMGLDFKKAGTVTNTGSIAGGMGGSGSAGAGGAGGAGVDLLAGALSNGGSIIGGTGGNGTSSGGTGGTGVILDGGTLTTFGTISGGAGGSGVTSGVAGDAVDFGTVASTLVVDPGAVFNGAIGTFGLGDTVDITNLTPTQVAADFNSTTHVLTTTSDGTLDFSGGFSNEYFVFSSDSDTGTDITLAAGSGISTTFTSTVTLGSAEFPNPLTITSSGVVAPTAAKATGVVSTVSGNALINAGAIFGGTGSNASAGGAGGLGVDFEMAGTVTNTGSIAGGTGGSGSAGAGGAGGAGVDLVAGTLSNSDSITGGAGGNGTTHGGAGGSGVILDGGTLTTFGTISGGAGGSGATSGAAGDAVHFGTVASTLVVDPGAVFNGNVVANASANDVLELAGTQSGGTPIALGTNFLNFATLEFAAGATGTVDATKGDLTAHMLTIQGFGLGDTLDITNLATGGTTTSFNTTNDVLTLTKGATTINVQFDSAFSGDHFVLTANGGGTDVTLQSGADAILAASAHDLMNFVGDEQRALMGDRFMPSAHGLESNFTLHTVPALVELGGHGLSADAFTDHGIGHASVMLR